MTISQLIARLHTLWEEHGDLEVRAYDYSDICPSPVETPEVETNGGGEKYALVRP
ncbi:hypothetical protein ACFPN0_15310 [Kitasatospora cinereorecta]